MVGLPRTDQTQINKGDTNAVIKTAADAAESAIRIAGVEIKELKSFPDERGFFREIIRFNDPIFGSNSSFAQWSHSRTGINTTKAWHFHHLQTDWWYIGGGAAHAVLFDLREESPTRGRKMEFILGDPRETNGAICAVVKIPPGVLHGYKTISAASDLFYITDQIYNPQDEGRHPFDSPLVPHSWGDPATLIVVERDKQTFIPPYPRARLA